jgi:hypothetical protein
MDNLHLSLICVSSHTFKTLRLENLLLFLLLVSSPPRNVILLSASAYVIYHFSAICLVFSDLYRPQLQARDQLAAEKMLNLMKVSTRRLNSSAEANSECRDSLSPSGERD